MAPGPTRRRSALAATAAALIATSFSAATASASPASAPVTRSVAASTPVPVPTPDGTLMSYLLNARHANPGQHPPRRAGRARRGRRRRPVLAPDRGRRGPRRPGRLPRGRRPQATVGNAVESVGATRTVARERGHARQRRRRHAAATGYQKGAKVRSTATPTRDRRRDARRRPSRGRAVGHVADQGRPAPTPSPTAPASVVVGVLDSGIDAGHPDLAANIDVARLGQLRRRRPPGHLPQRAGCPRRSDHGTHVAGTIAAARNGVGIVGVAPNVRIASVKVVNDDGFIYPEYAVCGFVWAGHAAHGRHQQQLLRRPVRVLVRRPARPGGRQGGRTSRRRAGRRSRASSAPPPPATAPTTWRTRPPTPAAPTTRPGRSPRTINNGCKDIPTELPGVVTVSSSRPARPRPPACDRSPGPRGHRP